MLGFGGDRLGTKRKGRRVEELYNATEIIDEAEVTPVLRGSCRMRGPVEETDLDNRKNMVTSQAERRSGKRSMSRRNRMRAESGTCNVCFAPCSSCMHLNLALMGSKTDEFSDETCRETTGSQYSNNESDGLHSCKGRPCDSLQHTASEASNLLSVNSSHDSFSVNAESKAAIRSSDRSAASEDFEMHIELLSSAAGAMAQLSPKPETGVDQRISLIKYEDPKGVEGLDDNISCVSRANDTNVAVTAVSDHDRSVDIKNLSHSSASVCSLGADGLGKTPSSQKLELSEIPLLKKVDASGGSPKGRSPVSQSQGDKCLIEGSSEAFTKVHPKSEVETDKDIGDPPDEAFKRSVQDKQDLKSTQLAEFPDMQPLQATSGDETDESDIVEHDVKVCDICGDAGREDLLAICSRCSDGAEHTYCMREMLQKIPEGDWLCEECKFAEETEKQKQGLDLEGKRTNKISASTQSSGKRQTENLEAAPAAKRQAIETSLGSPKSLSPGRTATLSRDSSFKGVDKGKVRSVSFGNHSSNDVVENTCPSKGTLLKSRSFSTLNSKAKVKLVDEVVHPKQKGTREQASFDIKEGITRVMSKSMSFKSANSVRSSAGESKVQMLSPRSSRVHDLKGLKQVKERNAFERKNLSRLDRSVPGSSMAPSAVSTAKVDLKLMPRGESISISSASNNRESKVVKAEGKGITLSKSNSNLGRQGVEVPVTPVGAFCMSGVCSSSVEHKPNLVSPKDEPSSSSSWTAEKPSTNVNEILQDALPRALESTNQGEKTSSSRPRSTITAGPKGVLCQKCREFGHEVESCPLGSPHVSGVDVSARRNSREDVIGGNKLKAALEAANKLPVTYGRNRVNDQSDGLCTTNIDLNCERASQDQLSVSNKRTYEVQTNKQTSMNHLKPFSAHSTDVVSPLRVGDSISTVPSFGKAGIRDLPGQALADISALKKISAIPEHEYIWQGGFEVHRQGKFLDLCGGIQAHLSSCASPKVLEIVNKFPQRIHLNEVPRLSTWPTMFHESGAEEDNIALYFFAKDLESYERIYKGLVDSMIKKDLALKGNLDSIELLIFPSNQLPETCQRWNMLFFLWGVFRVRRVSCSNSSKNSCTTGSNMVPLNPVTSTERTSVCQNLDLLTQTDKDSAARNSSHNMALGSYGPDKSCIAINGNCDKKVSSVQQASLGFQPNSEQQDGRLDSGLALRAATTMSLLSTEISSSPSLEECDLSERGQDTEVKTCQAIRNSIGSSKGGMMEMNGGTSFGENSSSIRNLPVGNHDVGEDRSVQAEKVPVIMKRSRNEINLERDMNDDSYLDAEIALEDLNSKGMGHQQSNHQSCPDLDLRETSQNSSGTSKRMQWNETFVDGESSSKKPKTVFSGAYECSSSIDRDYGDGFSSQIDDLGPSSSVAKRCEGLSDKKVLPNDLGAERYFFPVDSQRAEDFRLGANSVPWKVLSSKHEDQYLDGVPNLELALGAETKQPNKGMLPFFVGPLDKNNNQDKPPDKEGEEDVSASLSLSLSFPSSDKEQTSVKPASKSEQLMPERRHVNTSLILFGGFLDK